MSNVPEGMVTGPVAEAALEGGGGEGKEGTEEVVYLRTCCPKTNGRSLVQLQRLLLDTLKRVVWASCPVLVSCT